MLNETMQIWVRKLLQKLDGELSIGVELLDIPGWRTICALKSTHDLIIVAESTTEISTCSHCVTSGSGLQRYGQTRPKYVFDVPVRGRRVRVYFRLQRYQCTAKKCRKTSLQPLTGLDSRRRATERLLHYIEQESFKVNKTFVMVADEVGVSDQFVRNIFTDHAERLKKSRRIETPRWLAIDEVYIKKGRVSNVMLYMI